MASWEELPYPVLSRVFAFLPAFDIVNAAKVGASWKLVARKLLKKVKIDDSTSNNGSFYEFNHNYNERFNSSGEDERKMMDMKLFSFIKDLTEFTDEIEYVDIDVSVISGRCLEKLLLSQKAVKSVIVSVRRQIESDETRINAVEKCIIKHELTLEKINIGIKGYFIRFTSLANGLKAKESCFPNLKSIEFRSTTAGSFGMTEENDPAENFKQNRPIGEEKCAMEVFQKMFRKSQIEELNFRPKLPLDVVHNYPEVFWHPVYIRMLIKHFERGAFTNLKKINIDSLNTRGTKGYFSDSDAKLLIRYCPKITHIDSDFIPLHDLSEYIHPVYHEGPLIQLVEHYGHQLVYFHSTFMSTNIANCVYKKCPYLKNITIFDTREVNLADEALMMLAELKHLRSLKLILKLSHLNRTIPAFLGKVVAQLTSLLIVYREEMSDVFDLNILSVIGQNGAHLKKLRLYFNYSFPEANFIVIMDHFLALLQGCKNLSVLVFQVEDAYPHNHPDRSGPINEETCNRYYQSMTEMLINQCQKLRLAKICIRTKLPSFFKEKLLAGVPQCRFLFDDHLVVYG